MRANVIAEMFFWLSDQIIRFSEVVLKIAKRLSLYKGYECPECGAWVYIDADGEWKCSKTKGWCYADGFFQLAEKKERAK